jgi:putative peptide zinc metalloprotease protein
MAIEYCAYPPEIAATVEVMEDRDGGRTAYIVGSSATGRYVLLHTAEYQVFRLIGHSLTPAGICEEFQREHVLALPLPVLTKFLTKLDDIGVLAGNRRRAMSEQLPGTQFYLRFKLFDPDRLFTRMVTRLRWVWTPGFVLFSALLMLAALLLSLMNWAEVSSYTAYAAREHYVLILLAGTLVVFSHEFAHGLTCKAFGGPVRELGVLLIYYFLPGLFCNVSGVHFIRKRSRRLWVIAAGVYWQVLVGATALLAWFALAPYTLPADLAFTFFLGGVVDVVFNANPLIKLDGYYFLSQWLRMPNLMDRSRAYWRAALRRISLGKRETSSALNYTGRERSILAVFGAASFFYTVGLRVFIVCYAGSYLMDWFGLTGLLLSTGLAIFYMRQFLSPFTRAAVSNTRTLYAYLRRKLENLMANNVDADSPAAANAHERHAGEHKHPRWRRRLVPLSGGLLMAALLLMPWNASVGSYGTLVAIPGQEAIIRAPEGATLTELRVLPGSILTSGAVLGRMGNMDLDEQLAGVRTELARVQADRDRLTGELGVQQEAARHAALSLRQREWDYAEVDVEQQQIEHRRTAEALGSTVRLVTSLDASVAIPGAVAYPPAIATLAADVDLRRSKLEEANMELDRARKLFGEGLLARRNRDSAESTASAAVSEFSGARERLEAALIEHRRKHAGLSTEVDLGRANAGAAAREIEKLASELSATSALIRTLEERRRLLELRQASFELIAPRAGTVFGEDLPRSVGQFFQKGAEICRVADTRQLLLRIQVSERQIGDIRFGYPVRLRTRSFPDHVFRGVVSKIGGESERDQYDQATYRVELVIDNFESVLRPGMTAFARIDFGRQMIGRILLHKIRQALRPELWML